MLTDDRRCCCRCMFFFLCYITNHLMTGPEGNRSFCFPRIFPEAQSRETLRFEIEIETLRYPRDQSSSVYYALFPQFRSQICPEMPLIRCTRISISVTKCPLALTSPSLVSRNTYGLLTKREVKMTGYWPSSFFACLWTETKSRSINTQKKNEANIQSS